MATILSLIHYLQQLNTAQLWVLFLIENLAITLFVIFTGELIRSRRKINKLKFNYSQKDWQICFITNVCNTIITYLGFWLYNQQYIKISFNNNYTILLDFVILFLAMDILMYIFHIAIHKSALYKVVHRLHHNALHPKPIDLFVLHPIETMGFGLLWLALLLIYPFNALAIVIYLTVNIIFGGIGHLGIEIIPYSWQNKYGLKYLGSSTFHHNHHQNLNHNFGFYTSIWDRLFKTFYKD